VVVLFSSVLYSQTIDGQFTTNITPPTYSVTITVNLQGTAGTAGVVQIEFTYDSKVLDFPNSPVKNVDYTLLNDFDLYPTQNVTKSNDSTIRISLITLGNPPPVSIDTLLTLVVTYYFTIINAQGTSNLIWQQTDIAPEFLQQNYQIGVWPNLNEPLSNVTGLNNYNLSSAYNLSQNYPNPFNPSTTIRFSLPKETQLRINIYNMLGELVRTIAEGNYEAGYHKVTFSATGGSISDGNAASLPSGVYIYGIESDNFVQVKKMIVIK
jgi:uncharacterized protein Usg